MHPVGYVVHVKSPGKSGGETRSYQLAQALGATGANVHLYGQIDPSFGWFHKVHAHQLKRPVPIGMMQLMRDFTCHDVRVVIERYQLPPFNPGFFVQLIRNKPIIFEVHGFPIDEYKLFARRRDLNVEPIARIVGQFPPQTWERLQIALFKRAAHIIVTSTGTRNILANLGISREKLSVIYNRVDPKLFDPNGREQASCRALLDLPPDGQLVLFAGSFTEELVSVIEAASTVIRKQPSVCFVFLVSGPVSMLKTVARRFGLGDNQIHIIPSVSHQQMPDLLAAIDVVLAPYNLRSERFRKGFHYSPLKLLEALAMVKPVVTVDTAELRSVFGSLPNLQFVESGSSKEWAEGILRALEMSNNSLLKQGRAFVMNGYRWQDAAQMYLDIIRSTEERSH